MIFMRKVGTEEESDREGGVCMSAALLILRHSDTINSFV